MYADDAGELWLRRVQPRIKPGTPVSGEMWIRGKVKKKEGLAQKKSITSLMSIIIIILTGISKRRVIEG